MAYVGYQFWNILVKVGGECMRGVQKGIQTEQFVDEFFRRVPFRRVQWFPRRRGRQDWRDAEGGQPDNNEYYEVLGVSKTATQEEIKKKFNELARKHHPDRGGSSQKFAQIREAYETLGDPQRREEYDRYGKGHASGGGQEDLINMLLRGRGGRPSGRRELPKMKPTKKAFDLTLEMSYTGGIFPQEHERSRLCEACNGKGGKEVKKCAPCRGKGAVVQMTQMGPGMYQQTQRACEACRGEGEICPEGSRCKGCDGKKVVEKSKTIQVQVERGTPHNHPLVFSGEGNEVPDALAGDLVYITQEQPHPLFTRKGADLFLKLTISLAEALLGFTRSFKHLDGTEYNMCTNKGEIIADHDKKVLRNLGMPFFKDPTRFGNLIVEFKIQMPKRDELGADQLAMLAKVLPGKINPRPLDHNYEMLEDFEKEYVNSNEEGGQKKDEEEEPDPEEMHSGPSCQAQ